MMKNKAFILLVTLIISIIANMYLISEVQKFKKADIKQEKIFTEVADSLTYFRMQRDNAKNITSP